MPTNAEMYENMMERCEGRELAERPRLLGVG